MSAAAPPGNLRQAVASSSALLLGFALIMLGGGLQGTLLGLRAAMEGFATVSVGLIMSAYYGGFLVGSLVTVKLVSQVGHIRVFAALTSVASMTILLHALVVDVWVWAMFRFISGMCFAGIFIVVESWLNDRASNRTRGQLFAVYMMINFAGLAFGQFLLNVADPQQATLFIIVSVLVSLAAVPLVLSSTPAPAFDRATPLGIAETYRRSPMAVIGVTAAGLASGAIFGMAAVFAVGMGLSIAQTATFVAMPIFGAMLLQWPLGWISDRVDRRQVILSASTLGIVATVATLVAPSASVWLFVAMALLGGASMPIHGLAASHLNDQIAPDEMVAASGTLILLGGVGAACGPVLAATLMGLIGSSGFLWFFIGVHAVVLCFAVGRIWHNTILPGLQKRPWVATRPAGESPVAAQVLAEVQGEAGSAEADVSTEDGAEGRS